MSRLDRLVEEIVSGRRRLHRLPSDLSPREATAVRHRALERLSGRPLPHLAHHGLDPARVAKNCENLVGALQVPMGVVGPLRLHGEDGEDRVWVPLATTEGALVASANRGCSAVSQAGGAMVRVEDVGMTRAPVFRTGGVRETERFLRWVEEHEERIRSVAEATSEHLRLLDIRPQSMGTTVLLRFRFSTGDAMGMNMVTLACDRVVRDLVEPCTGVPCVALSGNYCVDKKPAAVNAIEGRGKRVWAEVTLDADLLDRLHTNATALAEVNYRKNLLGSVAAGSMGFNAHFANIVAAFFIATGQDPAHVVGGSTGVTCIEPRAGGAAYVSVYLPTVQVGVVGGGTELDTQREALELIGARCDPARPGRGARRVAEVLGAAVLAGELSLLSALASSDLARAHAHLARDNGVRPPAPSTNGRTSGVASGA